MKKTLFLIAAAILLIAVACGQGRTEREQTILDVFGRLNLDEDPYDNLFVWSNGSFYCRPFFADIRILENEPCANGDSIFLFGGTMHEGGYGMVILLDDNGKMTIAEEDWRFKIGDPVEYRVLGGEAFLIFRDARTDAIKEVLRKIDGGLYKHLIDNFYRYILSSSFRRTEGSRETIVFNQDKSTVSGLFPDGEASYKFIEDFGDTPAPVFYFSEDVVYKINRTLTGLELIPILTGPDIDLEWEIRPDESKPVISLVKIAADRSDLPPGWFPLASVQVMTIPEMELYAGFPTLENLIEIRNEIYARHGYIFEDIDWANYYSNRDWYNPKYEDISSKLTEIERINLEVIQRLVEYHAYG